MLVLQPRPASLPRPFRSASTVNPLTFGQALTLTATVSPGSATGYVTFYDGASILGTPTLSGGSGAMTTSLLASGLRSLRAIYSGDTTYSTATSSVLPESVTALPQNNVQTHVDYATGATPFLRSEAPISMAMAFLTLQLRTVGRTP